VKKQIVFPASSQSLLLAAFLCGKAKLVLVRLIAACAA
jgi:hypothetical protein